MSHVLLADNVDTTLASLLQFYNRCGVQGICFCSRKTCVADALSLYSSWASGFPRVQVFW